MWSEQGGVVPVEPRVPRCRPVILPRAGMHGVSAREQSRPEKATGTATHHLEYGTPRDLPIWIERYAGTLGCDASPAAIAVEIEDLLAERKCQRITIGQLRGGNAELRAQLASPAPEA